MTGRGDDRASMGFPADDPMRRCPVAEGWCARRECQRACARETKVSEEQAPYDDASEEAGQTARRETRAEIKKAVQEELCRVLTPPPPTLMPQIKHEQPPKSRELFWQEAAIAAMQGLCVGGFSRRKSAGDVAEMARKAADALLAEMGWGRG